MLRNLMLRMAANPTLVQLTAGVGRWSGLTRRFVAGETFEEAFNAVRQLNSSGIAVTLDHLGEGVLQDSEASKATSDYIQLLRDIATSQIQSGVSIKLTQLGLDIDQHLCADNLGRILEEAHQRNNFVRIDMEGSEYTESTLQLFRRFHKQHKENLGIVIQSYLRRSERDVRELASRGCNIRLCKGAYRETEEVAYTKKKDVDSNFAQLMEIMLTSNGISALATHDEHLIRLAQELISRYQVPDSQYEFQMLYGVRPKRQLELRRQGYPVRIYVPFGTQWAPYFMRRMAERPANVLFVLRSLLRRS